MPKPNKSIKNEEQVVLDKYIAEREKLSKSLTTRMNKNTTRDTMIEGVIGGLVAGLVVGLLVGETKGHTPVKNESGRITEYRINGKQAVKYSLQAIAATLLIVLAAAGAKALADIVQNRESAQKLAADTYKKYFSGPLSKYAQPDTETPIMREICAAALILNNMPETEVVRLRHLASGHLTRAISGRITINDSAIDSASQIIANFIEYNPEVGYNVMRIMRGDKPTTYFLPSMQKTR